MDFTAASAEPGGNEERWQFRREPDAGRRAPRPAPAGADGTSKQVGASSAVLVEVEVQSLGLDKSNNTPVVILQEVGGERLLPIWIGPGEASAIAMQLAEMEFSRPLTHDLLVAVLSGLGGELHKVVITKVEHSTYYAELLIRRNGEVISVDARPSDSIAVALRLDARIFAQEELLERATIGISGDEAVLQTEDDAQEEGPGSIMKPEELKEYLRRLNPEDFGRFTP